MISGLQGENGDLNNKYLKKKSKRVGRKYLGALRWSSQHATWAAKILQAEKSPFCKKRLISQLALCDFTACEIAFQLGVVVFQWT